MYTDSVRTCACVRRVHVCVHMCVFVCVFVLCVRAHVCVCVGVDGWGVGRGGGVNAGAR